MSKIIDCIMSSLGPIRSIVESFPNDIPGVDAVEKFITEFFQDRNGSQRRITLNEIESSFYSIFHLANSRAFNTAQAIISSKDALAYQMPSRDDFDDLERYLISLGKEYVDIPFVRFWDCHLELFEQEGIDWLKSDEELINWLCESLVFAYKVFYTNALNKITEK